MQRADNRRTRHNDRRRRVTATGNGGAGIGGGGNNAPGGTLALSGNAVITIAKPDDDTHFFRIK